LATSEHTRLRLSPRPPIARSCARSHSVSRFSRKATLYGSVAIASRNHVRFLAGFKARWRGTRALSAQRLATFVDARDWRILLGLHFKHWRRRRWKFPNTRSSWSRMIPCSA
jgi:hypothetical protein